MTERKAAYSPVALRGVDSGRLRITEAQLLAASRVTVKAEIVEPQQPQASTDLNAAADVAERETAEVG